MGGAQVLLARDRKCMEKRSEADMLVLEALHMDRERIGSSDIPLGFDRSIVGFAHTYSVRTRFMKEVSDDSMVFFSNAEFL